MAKKILIVDDSKTIRQQLNFTLSKDGFEVVEADDGNTGFEALKANADIAMIISDVNMPNMNGIEMVKAIQAAGKWPNLPILMLTTEGAKELIDQAKNAGAKGWLTKPFQSPQLVAAVKKLTSA